MEASVGWHGDATWWRRGNTNVTCNTVGIESVEAAEMWPNMAFLIRRCLVTNPMAKSQR
ncbi:hypothetical protein B0H10DRAFT_2099139, partial [Mycena sp. CBHHK59/15]